MRSVADRFSWPARRWLCDRLVGRHAYAKNSFTVTPSGTYSNDGVKWTIVGCKIFDQESA